MPRTPISNTSNASTASNTTAVDEAVLTLARLLGEAVARELCADGDVQSPKETQIDGAERED
jgi:hypothetical protein